MFEFGRDLKRLFGVDAGGESRAAAHREGLTGGDTSLLELLDMRLLTNEARSADVAAGRIGVKDRGSRLLEAAIVWRELARRSGDAAALRKAASHAEAASKMFESERRQDALASARCEQATLAILGADLFGDEGLNAAAGAALTLARTAPSQRCGLAMALIAGLDGRAGLAENNVDRALAAVQGYDAPLRALAAAKRTKGGSARLMLADQRASGGRADPDLRRPPAGPRPDPTGDHRSDRRDHGPGSRFRTPDLGPSGRPARLGAGPTGRIGRRTR